MFKMLKTYSIIHNAPKIFEEPGNKQIKPVNSKDSRKLQYFKIVFGTLFGQCKYSPEISDFKPPKYNVQ